MKGAVLVLTVFTLSGCINPWQEVKRERIGEPFQREEACSTYGYCLQTSFNSKGELETGFGWSSDCPGRHDVKYQRWKVWYKRPASEAKTPEVTYEVMQREIDEELESSTCR